MISAAKPNMNLWNRIWRHWLHPRMRVKRHLPTLALRQLTDQIGLSEQQHNGQVRFVIESNLSTADVFHHITADNVHSIGLLIWGCGIQSSEMGFLFMCCLLIGL